MDRKDSDRAFDEVLDTSEFSRNPEVVARIAAENKLREDAAAFYQASASLNGRTSKDPAEVEKILDAAGGACAVRKLAQKAGESWNDNFGSQVRYSFEVNRARDEETIVISSHNSSSRSSGSETFRYTQSPACKPGLEKAN